MRISHILVTTDLSEEALRPFAPVRELARRLGARLTLLYVVPELHVAPHGAPLAPPITIPDLPRELAEARAALGRQRDAFAAGVDVAIDVVSNESAARGVVEYAKRHAVDLIALSTHGRTGFRRLALGSVAEQVLRQSPIPVLSFHREEP